jgi:ABC-type phosphate transport system substrate-binding protein
VVFSITMTERKFHLSPTRSRPRGRSRLLARVRPAGRTSILSRSRTQALAGATALLVALALPAIAAAKTTLIGSGSSAAQPYMLQLFKAYSKIHKNIKFLYNPDGGNAGVTDVQGGHSQFAIQTAPPVVADSGTIFEKLFLDALCIDVNSGNGVSNITIPTLKNIFTGVDSSWSQVSGSPLSTTIDPYGRTSSAGQYTFFKSAVLGSSSQSEPLVQQEASDGLVAEAVEHDANGIGYVGLANSTHSGEKAVEVNGVPCTAAYVRSESYPLFRYDWGVLPKSHPNVQVEEFFDWVRTSAAAGKIINGAGAVAAFNK